ncbi:unnamed protein product, partial [marine sediment metagenome]
MAEETTEKIMMTMVIAIMGVLILSQVVLAVAPTPPEQFVCPICSEVFSTYDELYAHFTIDHPA